MQLELNEKKIRKGKPIGLPYIGSKKRIAKRIVGLIIQNFGRDKTIYDIFGGGGAITFECLVNDLDVVYNDKDPTVIAMLELALNSDREFIKTLIVTRDEFFEIKDKENKTPCDELKLLINSFGNNRRGYLYAKKWADIKYNLAKEIIENHDVFSGYLQTETYLNHVDKIKRVEHLERPEQLQQLQGLDQIDRIQDLSELGFRALSLDYTAFSDVTDSILYLDPPYDTGTEYYKHTIDYQAFYDWAYEMSKKNLVLISNYDILDTRFTPVYEFKKTKSTLQSGVRSQGECEKIFMVKEK